MLAHARLGPRRLHERVPEGLEFLDHGGRVPVSDVKCKRIDVLLSIDTRMQAGRALVGDDRQDEHDIAPLQCPFEEAIAVPTNKQ